VADLIERAKALESGAQAEREVVEEFETPVQTEVGARASAGNGIPS